MSHRRLQFSLRSLFVLTAIVALGCLIGPPVFDAMAEAWDEGIFRFDNHDRVAAAALVAFALWFHAHRRTNARRVPDDGA
jgi:hypothetical protein